MQKRIAVKIKGQQVFTVLLLALLISLGYSNSTSISTTTICAQNSTCSTSIPQINATSVNSVVSIINGIIKFISELINAIKSL
jgi:hypoxanthine-guanine phosphoribosyltransferase